jgi:folate-binding Fe-S cluster repair protein YgfZ
MTAVLVESGPDAGAVWHIGQPNHEQRALAAGSAWADLSHRGVVSVSGIDRLTWLHALTTQHLEKLPMVISSTNSFWSMMARPPGCI